MAAKLTSSIFVEDGAELGQAQVHLELWMKFKLTLSLEFTSSQGGGRLIYKINSNLNST